MKKPPVRDILVNTIGIGTYEGMARAAMEISKQDAAALRHIRDALQAGDDNGALVLMREFFEFRDGSTDEKSIQQ